MKNDHFIALVPYWAIWPYETIIVPIKHYQHIEQLDSEEQQAFAEIIKDLKGKAFDKCFN